MRVTISDELHRLLADDHRSAETAVTRYAVLGLYQAGRISSGKGAELLGVSKRDFLDLLTADGIPYFHYTPEELEDEARSVATVAQAVE